MKFEKYTTLATENIKYSENTIENYTIDDTYYKKPLGSRKIIAYIEDE